MGLESLRLGAKSKMQCLIERSPSWLSPSMCPHIVEGSMGPDSPFMPLILASHSQKMTCVAYPPTTDFLCLAP